MNKSAILAIVVAILVVLAGLGISCACFKAPPPVVADKAPPCPPGSKYCPAPKGAPEEIGADATKVGQLLDPVTVRARVYYADGAETRDTEARVAAGVWLVPEGVDPKLEAPAK